MFQAQRKGQCVTQPPVSYLKGHTSNTSLLITVLKGCRGVKCIKRVKGKRGGPDRVELVVNIDSVRIDFHEICIL